MYISSLLLAGALAARTAFAHPYKPASGLDFQHAQLQKRAGQVITSGATGLGDGQPHARLEISDLAANRPDQWSLYVRTMIQWKEGGQDSLTSYYGVSSIHGVPRESYDGVEPCDSCGGADGYCPHDSVLFPGWHRAYMALYEQEFIKAATEVANSFSEGDFKDRMVEAAKVIRITYWDWAAAPDSQNTLPSVISAPQVTIAGENGQETVDNPFYTFQFSDPSGLYYTPFTDWPGTLRYPDSNSVNATSQEAEAVSALDSIRENMQDQVYTLLTQCGDYLQFATDDAGSSSAQCANSLEAIHNTIHNNAGGQGGSDVSGGHLTYLPLSSYDPIFWCHHANVDRLFALWQTVHPDSYGASQVAPHSTWTIASGSTQDADSPLEPFRKDADNFWTTNDLQDWTILGYTYPEFANSDGSKASIVNYINSLYGSSQNATAGSISEAYGKQKPSEQAPASTSVVPRHATTTSAGYGPTGTSTAGDGGFGIGIGIGPISMSIGLPWGGHGSAAYPTGAPSHGFPTYPGGLNGTATRGYPAPTGSAKPEIDPSFVAPNGSTYEYQCNIHTPRYAFDGSYSIYVFDGAPADNNTARWMSDSNCIGTIGVVGGGKMANMDLLISGSVPATRHLQKKCKAGEFPDMSEKYVVPYMTKNLNWKIVYKGEEVHPDALSGFKSSFFTGLTSPAGWGELPKWSDLIPQIDVTKGKAGGVKQIADAIGNTIGEIGDSIGDLIPGYSSPSESKSSGYTPSETKPAGYAPSTSTEGSPVITDAPKPSSPAYDDEEETITIYVTEYTTVCPCKESATSAPVASAY